MELIKITKNEKGEQLVSARELHIFLESKQDFTTWIKNRIEKYGFVENEEFTLHKFMVGKNWKHDYVLKSDVAKEISMVEGNEKGKLARKYFIECEKQSKEISIPSYQIADPIQRANAWIEEQKEKQELEGKNVFLENKIKEDEHRVSFAETIEKASDSILVRDLSKILGNEGIKLGQNKLYRKLREYGYICKNSTEPTQRAINQGLLVVSERIVTTVKGDITSFTTKVTGRGQIFLLEKIKKELKNK